MIGELPHGIFINSENTIYVAARQKNQILIWFNGSIDSARIVNAQLFDYTSLFVTMNSDIYSTNSNEPGRIDKWSKNSMNNVLVKNFPRHCRDIFIDVHNFLYCSIIIEHRVVKISLNKVDNTVIAVAGIGGPGSASNRLNEPNGIYVDVNFNVYVADSGNNRIQLFTAGQKNGITTSGQGIPANLILSYPIDIILDADDYLYIVDNDNHRIIRSKDDQFLCIIGCTGKYGTAPNELHKPYAIQFDPYGNLYVVDEFNSCIQKFKLATSSCGKYQQITMNLVFLNLI